MITRRQFLASSSAAALAISGCTRNAARKSSQTPAGRPNVLFILCDDMRWDCMSCAGHPHLKTPHIDRLAAQGARFANAFCTTSLCSPSRASILSGLYAHRHGVVNNFTEYPNQLTSFHTVLHDSGYETAYMGKWHMGEDNDNPRPGFDHWISHKGQGKYFGTEFNIDGARKTDDRYYTHAVTDFAVDFIKRDRKKPFLLMLGHKAPHSFYIPEPRYERLFANAKIEYPDTAFQLEGKPEWINQRLDTWHGIYGPLFDWRKKFPDRSPEAVKDFANMTRAYWATIQSVDDSVGRLVEALRALGQLDDTIIIFMGDNGLLNGENGMVDKRTMHEPSIRIPLVVRYPRAVSRRRTIEEQVLTHDIAPSVLEMCGAPALKNIHGESFASLASSGKDPAWRKSWFYEYNYEKQFPYTPNVRGVRTDDWKYMHYPHGDGSPDRHMAELYHLKRDPDERKNLIDDPARASTVATLRQELRTLMAAAGAIPDRMPVDAGIKTELPDQKIR